tara:strand:+ start:207 stop:467 length:261 start_codon:yes stop_codon:yes gene_type:complete
MRDLLNKITKNFILGEGKSPSPSLFTYIQSLNETLSNIRARTQTDARRLSIAKEHLKEIKKGAKRLYEEVQLLEERLSILEENKKD